MDDGDLLKPKSARFALFDQTSEVRQVVVLCPFWH
jgi:hypothetical protein